MIFEAFAAGVMIIKTTVFSIADPTSSVSSVIAVNKTVNEGESFAVECIGTGYPVPEVFISRTVNPSHVLRQGKGLAIWNRDWASVDDDGTYNCIAKQGRNIVKRIVILLRVNSEYLTFFPL